MQAQSSHTVVALQVGKCRNRNAVTGEIPDLTCMNTENLISYIILPASHGSSLSVRLANRRAKGSSLGQSLPDPRSVKA